jgi:hypothetical protein
MMSLDTKITVGLQAFLAGVNDLGQPAFPLNYSKVTHLATGVAAGKADKIFSDSRSVAGAATDTLDLAGTLLDPFGVVVSFTKVKGILIVAGTANPGTIKIAPDATNPFLGPFLPDETAQLEIGPGGIALLTSPSAGWPVVAATGDKLTVINSHATIIATYEVIIFGTSA